MTTQEASNLASAVLFFGIIGAAYVWATHGRRDRYDDISLDHWRRWERHWELLESLRQQYRPLDPRPDPLDVIRADLAAVAERELVIGQNYVAALFDDLYAQLGLERAPLPAPVFTADDMRAAQAEAWDEGHIASLRQHNPYREHPDAAVIARLLAGLDALGDVPANALTTGTDA